MTTHKLADLLGGRPVTRVPAEDSEYLLAVRVQEEGVGTWTLMVPPAMVGPVKPPLPPEPREGSVVRVDYLNDSGEIYNINAFHRDDRRRPQELDRWWGAGNTGAQTWAEVCELGPVTVMVPDPAPTELPVAPEVFVDGADDSSIHAFPLESGMVRLDAYTGSANATVDLSPADAARFAGVVLASARKAAGQ